MAEEPRIDVIKFQAQVFKIATLIDGGLRLTLDLGPVAPETIVALFDAKQPGVMLEVAAISVVKQGSNKRDIQKRSEWQPEG